MRQTHCKKSRNVPRGVALNLLASALTILAAIALLGATAVFGDASATVPVSGRHERVIHDFYSAVNEVLWSGDSAALDRIVAPDLVFHPPSSRIASNRAGLDRYLTSIHDNFPAFQLQAEDIVSDGDRAVARVVEGSEKPGHFLGLILAAPPSTWGQFDSFRIGDHQIVEIWSDGPEPVLFEPATEVRLDLQTNPQALSFERLSASTGQDREWGPFFGARVLYVDEGAITVDLSPTEPSPLLQARRTGQVQPTEVAPGMQIIVTAGDAMSFPLGSRYTFRHDTTDPGVAAFAVALPRFTYNGPLQPHEPPATEEDIQEQAGSGEVHTALGEEQVLDPLAGVTVAFGRALLPSGANIAFHEADGYLFVVVETGALVLTNEHDVMSLDRLDTAGPALVKPGEPFALHNLGDDVATAFMVTVLPRNTLAAPAS
jgi:predicted ester cyclase